MLSVPPLLNLDISLCEGLNCRLWQLTDSWHGRAAQRESPAALRLCDRREDKQEGVRRHVSAPCPAPASAPEATGPFCSAPAEPCLAGRSKKERCWLMAQALLLRSHGLFVYVFKLSFQPAHTENIFSHGWKSNWITSRLFSRARWIKIAILKVQPSDTILRKEA